MMKALKLYITVFLVAGLGSYLLYTGAIYIILGRNPFPNWLIAFVCIIYGFFMSIIIVTLHIKNIKPQNQKSQKSLGVNQSVTIDLKIPYESFFNICIESLGEIKGIKITNQDITTGTIAAKTPMTWKSFGELITFEITKVQDDISVVTISSRPTLKTTLVDYGKNLENIEKIETKLKSEHL